MGRLHRLLLAAVMLAALSTGVLADPQTALDVELVMPQLPALGEEAILECTLESAANLENVSLEIRLPQGVELVDGDLTWVGNIAAFQKNTHPLKIKVTTPGNKNIRATAFCRVDERNAHSDLDELFFHSDAGVASWGYVLDVVPWET